MPQEREKQILHYWDTSLNEVLEMTDYPHYRGVPTPENLNKD